MVILLLVVIHAISGDSAISGDIAISGYPVKCCDVTISCDTAITEVTKTLVTSLVLSRLDYCNDVLAGTSKKFLSRLQVVQNNAARLILKKKNSTSATPLLKELHWLPIAQRIDYICALLCFKCIHGVAPHYLRETSNLYKPKRSLRSTED